MSFFLKAAFYGALTLISLGYLLISFPGDLATFGPCALLIVIVAFLIVKGDT